MSESTNMINLSIFVLVGLLIYKWYTDQSGVVERYNSDTPTNGKDSKARADVRKSRRDSRRELRRDSRRKEPVPRVAEETEVVEVAEVARVVGEVKATRAPAPVSVEKRGDKSVNIVQEHQRFQEKQLERSAISDSSELLPPSLENNTWGDCTFVLQPNADDANKRMLPEVPQSYRNNDLQLGREVLVVSQEDLSPWNKSSISEQTLAYDESSAPCAV